MVIRGRGNGEGEEGGNIYAVSTKGVNRARLTSEGRGNEEMNCLLQPQAAIEKIYRVQRQRMIPSGIYSLSLLLPPVDTSLSPAPDRRP